MSCNTTIYLTHYIPKPVKRVEDDIEKNKQRFIIKRNLIADSFKSYLYVNKDDETLYSQDVDEYYEKAKDTYPWFGKIMENQRPDRKYLQKERMLKGKTTYQVQYCDLEKEIAYKEFLKRTAIRLSPDIVIPHTTYGSIFRNPIMRNSKAYQRILPILPRNSLVKDDKLSNILQITTGQTTYMEVTDKLGKEIIEEQLHGVIKHSRHSSD